MKYAIATLPGNEVSFLTIKQYADKIGVSLEIIQNKFEIFNLFKNYDSILFLSNTILVRNDCPNLFDEIPKNKLGILLESKFRNSLKDYYEGIRHYDEYKNMKFKGDWYNTDVMLIPKINRYIFKNPHFYGEENLPDEKYIINCKQ